MSDPAVRRIVVGVDGSAESAVALRWACREAALRRAEVHAVHAREVRVRSMASYAVPAQPQAGDSDVDVMWRSVLPGLTHDVRVRTEVADGLTARVLLERSEGADMLVLGTGGDVPGGSRSAGPVIRACLRRAPCPVVVISAARERRETPGDAAASGEMRVPVPVGAGAGVPVPAGTCG